MSGDCSNFLYKTLLLKLDGNIGCLREQESLARQSSSIMFLLLNAVRNLPVVYLRKFVIGNVDLKGNLGCPNSKVGITWNIFSQIIMISFQNYMFYT